MTLTIASPRPAPPSLRARPESGRRKRSKACGRKSAGKPGPESRTSMTRSAPAALADRTIGVPAGANRSALSTRLSTASRMRSGSMSAVSSAGAFTSQETPAALAAGQFELAAQDGKRGAQLVAGVGDQCPLPGQRAAEPAQQLVHRLGQGGDLVAGPRDLDARRPVALGQRGDLAARPRSGEGGVG